MGLLSCITDSHQCMGLLSCTQTTFQLHTQLSMHGTFKLCTESCQCMRQHRELYKINTKSALKVRLCPHPVKSLTTPGTGKLHQQCARPDAQQLSRLSYVPTQYNYGSITLSSTLNRLSYVPTQYNYGSITLSSTLNRLSYVPTQYNYGSITLSSTLNRLSCIPTQCDHGSTALKKHQWLNCHAANLDLSVLAEEAGVMCNEAGLLGAVQEKDKH